MRSSQAAWLQPVRPEISTNGIENNLEATDLEDTEDEDNADELGESWRHESQTTTKKAFDTRS